MFCLTPMSQKFLVLLLLCNTLGKHLPGISPVIFAMWVSLELLIQTRIVWKMWVHLLIPVAFFILCTGLLTGSGLICGN